MELKIPLWLKYILVLLGVYLVFKILYIGQSIIIPLAFAGLFAVLLDPLCDWLEKFKLGHTGAILTSMLAFLLVIAGLLFLVTIQFMEFSDQIPQMTERLKQYTDQLVLFLEDQLRIGQEQQIQYLNRGINNLIDRSGEFATTIISTTTNVFTFLVLLPIYTFFLLYYRDMLHNFLLKLAEKYDLKGVEVLKENVQGVIQRYIIGMGTVILILAFLNTTGLLLIGLDHALFFGGFAAFLALIPYVGIILGALPPVLFALLMYDSLLYAAGVIAVFATVQFLEGNFITPNVMSSQVSINPLAAMLALFIGAQLWGIAGMILFIPLIGIMKVVFDQVDALRPYGYLLGNTSYTEK